MKYCKYCENVLNDSLEVCSVCGSANITGAMFCYSCGVANANDTEFCRSCGVRLNKGSDLSDSSEDVVPEEMEIDSEKKDTETMQEVEVEPEFNDANEPTEPSDDTASKIKKMQRNRNIIIACIVNVAIVAVVVMLFLNECEYCNDLYFGTKKEVEWLGNEMVSACKDCYEYRFVY